MTPPSTFATCLSCIDGRVTAPATRFIKETHGVEFVDYITEAGMDGFISCFGPLDGILRKIDISFQKHGSRVLYVVGHAECSGHSVSEEQHKTDIVAAIERLKVFRSFTAIGGLFVTKNWKVLVVKACPTIQPAMTSGINPPPMPITPTSPSPTPQRMTVQPVAKIALPRIAPSTLPAVPSGLDPKRVDQILRRVIPRAETDASPAASVLKCPACGAPNLRDSNFCDQCSELLRKA